MGWSSLAPGLALVAGAAAGIEPGVPAAAVWLLPVFVAAAAMLWARRRPRAGTAAATIGFALCGALLASHASERALHGPLRALLDRECPGFSIDTLGPPPPHDPIAARILLTEDAAPAAEVTTLRARVQGVRLRERWQAADDGVIVSVGGAAAMRGGVEWTAGRTLELPLVFRRPARYLNDGVPDVERDLALGGTALFASAKSGLLVEVRQQGSVLEETAALVRGHVRAAVARWVGSHDALAGAITTAVLIGDRTGLPDDIRLRLQAAGTYHVIAISGGNIAILAAVCFGLLRLTGLAGRPGAFATLAMLVAYALVVTAGASVWRASVMAGIYLAARLLDHRSPPWHALAVTAGLVVVARPLDVRDVGFLLTFGATCALLDVARRVPSWPPRRWLATWLLASLAASVAAEIALLPVSARAFSRVTSAGLALNLLAVPLMGVVQVAGLLVAAARHVDVIAAPAGWVAYAAAHLLVESARLVEAAPWLSARVPPPAALLVAVYYVALSGVLFGRPRLRVGAAAVLAGAAMAIATGTSIWPQPARAPVRLTLFDVGQGDAMLLQTPDGRALLVDTGGRPFGGGSFDIGARVLAPALWARGVRSLDAILLTHGDPDHIGGAPSLVADFAPGALWQGIPVERHAPLRDLLAAAGARGIPVLSRAATETLTLDGVRLRILHPPPADWERQRVRNDDSVVLEVLYRDVAMLLTGDIGAATERAILPQLTPARIRILKVAHHGSRTSSSRELLEGWRPQIALISAGRGNTFGHPTPEVLQRLAAIGATVYRTDRHGQITVDSDGREVRVRTFVGGS